MVLFSYIFVFLAAICNAFMDIVENENFYNSIFGKLNERFWYKRVSWKYAKVIFSYKIDAWHLAKSFMVIFMCLSVVFYSVLIPIVDFILLGLLWNLTFNLFYNRIFKARKKQSHV